MDFATFIQGFEKRFEYFASVGGKLSDHGINTFHFIPASEERVLSLIHIYSLNKQLLTYKWHYTRKYERVNINLLIFAQYKNGKQR